MNRPVAVLTLITMICFVGSVVAQTPVSQTQTPQSLIAQTAVPQPDGNGDFFSNIAPISGEVATGRSMQGSLWQVVSPGLNCRSSAGTNYEIVRQFSQGDILQADVGRGGADEVLENTRDDRGKPWMRARSEQGESYNCYVRANSRYIQPVAGIQ